MTMTQPLVEKVGYIGGQDDEVGGYCEPLIIRSAKGEHYVLHEMHTYYDGDEIKAKDSKVEFATLEELLRTFHNVERRLAIDISLPWMETTPTCGYDIPIEEFQQASLRRLGLLK